MAPMLIHNGHSVVPYFTWELRAGYPSHHTAGGATVAADLVALGNGRVMQSQGRPPQRPGRPSYHQQQQKQQRGRQQRNGQNMTSAQAPKQNTGRRKSESDWGNGRVATSGGMRPSSSSGSLASNEAAIRMAAMTALAGARGDSSIYASCISAPSSMAGPDAAHIGRLWGAHAAGMPSVTDASDDAPDLERFLRVATPSVPRPDVAEGFASLRLSDLWRCFDHSSAFGLECPTLGGARGPSNCYFVPFLSAVQIYEPVGEDETGEDIFAYPQGLDSWPGRMRRCCSWAAADHVAERLPVHQRIQELCGEAGENHPLMASRLLELHPYSWFAVAWYPLYRIPEAPLTARFLTFHSLAPLWEAATEEERMLQNNQQQGAAAEAAAAGAPPSGNGAASYKLMLAGGGANGGAEAGSTGMIGAMHARRLSSGHPATPTGVTSYPGSPLASDVTRTGTTSAASWTHSGRSQSVVSAPATASDTASVTASFGSSAPHSPTGSEAGDKRPATLGGPPSEDRDRATFLGPGSVVEVPAVGLCWHTVAVSSNGRSSGDNWTETLVAVDLPAQMGARGLRKGDALPGPTNARVAGVWPGTAVIRKDYPLAKGGPLSWEIQMEELEEGAKRLALSLGLVKAGVADDGPAAGEEGSEESCCPDFDFFWARRR